MRVSKVLGIIPARLKSTRLPRKMLADICGKPLICRTYENAKRAKLLDDLIVATDSREIYDAVIDFGGKAIMTSARHQSGSDRVAEAAKKYKNFRADIIVNIQGDEPLLKPSVIDAAIKALLDDPVCPISTVASKITREEVANPSISKVVIDKTGKALYFSRSPIPYEREPRAQYLGHIGLYAFRWDFLFKFTSMVPSKLEQAECLEQLRILENGYPIKVVVVESNIIGVDTPEDLARVGKIFTLRNARLAFCK